ncbi:MAG: methylated-DNA--[protein]-cysteine S-methyltransferase [Planctomycetota bacterium]
MNHWLLKTSWGWCGLIIDRDTIKAIILPSDNKSLVLKRLGKNCNPPCLRRRLRAGRLFIISDSLNEKQITNCKLRPHVSRFLKDLNRYFNGEKVDFRYKIDLRDSSDFEKSVYKVLRTIPYGTIRTYKWVAEKVGCPKGSRAVGNALAKNPLPLIIPCHRIVRSDGSLGSFSAIGGVKLKKRLLEVEGAI